MKILGSIGLGFGAGKHLESNESEPSKTSSQSRSRNQASVRLEGNTNQYFKLKASSASKTSDSVTGSAVILNETDSRIEARFRTYFLGTLDGEQYGFQGSVEVQGFEPKSEEEVRITTNVNPDFDLEEYIVVFVGIENNV